MPRTHQKSDLLDGAISGLGGRPSSSRNQKPLRVIVYHLLLTTSIPRLQGAASVPGCCFHAAMRAASALGCCLRAAMRAASAPGCCFRTAMRAASAPGCCFRTAMGAASAHGCCFSAAMRAASAHGYCLRSAMKAASAPGCCLRPPHETRCEIGTGITPYCIIEPEPSWSVLRPGCRRYA